ncbi:MAG: protein kinase (serine/threonine-protein kinase)-like protein [Ramlibacter sp.]|nr:protein kinase (serine/threonine-protein kinase)-like protein [Ramlibacter sp.]
MGVVYEGRDPNLDRRVAIKTVKVENLSEEAAAEYEHRFRTEARSAARLQHPNIVSVYDSDRDADVAFLVMEYIQGDDLKHHLDRGVRYSLEQSLKIIRDLLSALDYAHKQGIVHRDIKPANLLIEPGGRVKLTDFGVARIQDSGEATRTQGSMVGTLKYMAPEQVQGQKIDSRADLFSVGVVLYQLLTDKRPFDGDNDFSIIHQIIGHHPPAPSSINPRLPAALDAVVARALAKTREERFETARDFAVALQAAIRRAEDQTVVPPANPNKRVEGGASRPLTRPGTSPGGGTNPSSGTISSVTQELELVYWKDVKDSDDPEDLEGFLDKFPAGIYADLARRRLRKLAGDPTNTVNALPVSALIDPEATRMRDPSVPSIPPTYPLGTADPRAASPELRPAQWIDEEYTKTLVEAPSVPPAVSAPPAAAAPAAPTSPLMAAGEAALAAASAAGSRSDPSTTPLSPPQAAPAPVLAPAPVAAAPVTMAARPEGAAAKPPVAVPLKTPTRAVDGEDTTAPPVRRRKVPVAAVAGIAVLAVAGLAAVVMGRSSAVAPEASVAAAAVPIAATTPAPAAAPATAPVTVAAAPGDVTPVPPPANPLAARPVAAQSPAAPAAAQAKKPPPKAARTVAATPQPVEPVRPITSAAAPAPRAEPEPPRPVPPPSIASANAAAMHAVDECRDKMFLSREICLKDKCGKSGARIHPMCVIYREDVRLGEESKQLPQNR